MINVLVADDQPLFRKGVKQILAVYTRSKRRSSFCKRLYPVRTTRVKMGD